MPIRSAVRTFRAAFFLLRNTNFARRRKPAGVFLCGERCFIHHVMPGLVPGIHDWQHRHMAGGWVYITTNRPQGTLYVGVTADIAQRIQQHRDGVIDSFTKRYGLKRLVYAEPHLDIRQAIQREKTIKHWPRAWKVRIIQADNPDWDDLYDRLMA